MPVAGPRIAPMTRANQPRTAFQCPLVADFVAEVAEEESGRWRRAINLACHSPVRGVAGDYSNDCQRDFGMS